MSTCAAKYSRHSPSPRYRALLSQYAEMHAVGDVRRHTPAEETYRGYSLPSHAQVIKHMIDEHGARTILDYGAGKGTQYTSVCVKLPGGARYPSIPVYWGIESLTCYDPAYEPFRRLPTGQFDGVVCTDVLEHCPAEDLEWIVHELFAFARRFVYANVACYPADKCLPTGENAHCTIRPASWWVPLLDKMAVAYPPVRFRFVFESFQTQPDGVQRMVADVVKR